jgi:transcriptional regulator with XRE-family HTH domain
MDPILGSVGEQVRRLRKARGLTQRAFGATIGIDPNLLGRIERGEQNLTVRTLARIAAGLDVDLTDLVRVVPRSALRASLF